MGKEDLHPRLRLLKRRSVTAFQYMAAVRVVPPSLLCPTSFFALEPVGAVALGIFAESWRASWSHHRLLVALRVRWSTSPRVDAVSAGAESVPGYQVKVRVYTGGKRKIRKFVKSLKFSQFFVGPDAQRALDKSALGLLRNRHRHFTLSAFSGGRLPSPARACSSLGTPFTPIDNLRVPCGPFFGSSCSMSHMQRTSATKALISASAKCLPGHIVCPPPKG